MDTKFGGVCGVARDGRSCCGPVRGRVDFACVFWFCGGTVVGGTGCCLGGMVTGGPSWLGGTVVGVCLCTGAVLDSDGCC